MLSFDDQMHIYTRKTIYLHLSTLYWEGGRGGRGDYAQIVPLQITIVVLNDSLVIFWMAFTSVPTTFDLHCSLWKSFIHSWKTFTIDQIHHNLLDKNILYCLTKGVLEDFRDLKWRCVTSAGKQ